MRVAHTAFPPSPPAGRRSEDVALSLARERLGLAQPLDMAWRADALYHAGTDGTGAFDVCFLNRPLRITYPAGQVTAAGGPAKPALALLVLHYLLHADGTRFADRWVAFHELPDGRVYDYAFRNRVGPALLGAFGAHAERFHAAAQALQGRPLALGDAAYAFAVLPRLPMAIILHVGDDELSPAVSVLFDGAAGHYLPTEDLAVLGGMLVGALLKVTGAGDRA